jgi:Na+-transporting methylmalonyl-CoA/oxaloacetate decarboxylase gamma subunit
MLPSEKAERWVRQVGYAALILIVLYILVWLVRFISGIMRDSLEQREAPPEARAPVVEVRAA